MPNRPETPAPCAPHLVFGAAAEALAADWYRNHGYEVVERNWRCAGSELDLVAWRVDGRRPTVVIVEVKARRRAGIDSPATAVGWAKQRRLRLGAVRWLAEYPQFGGAAVRFDVVAITGDDPSTATIDVFEGAF